MWAASMRVRFHPILPTISVGLDRFLNQTAQNTGFSATTNGCDSSRSKVKWWEIADALSHRYCTCMKIAIMDLSRSEYNMPTSNKA
jgi:hypothetical protein